MKFWELALDSIAKEFVYKHCFNLLLKCSKHKTKEFFVSPANSSLVGILITIGYATDIFVIQLKLKGLRCLILNAAIFSNGQYSIEVFFFFQQYLSDLTKEEQLTKVRILRISIPAWYVQFPYFLNFNRAFETCNRSLSWRNAFLPRLTCIYCFLFSSQFLKHCNYADETPCKYRETAMDTYSIWWVPNNSSSIKI